MPIVRADVPEWLTHEQCLEIRKELHGCIARTWFKEHIWVAVRPYTSEPEERTVIVTAAISSYPPEIPLGRISAVYQDPDDELSMIVEVELANDVTDLGFVTVVLVESLDQIQITEVVPATTVPLSTDDTEGDEVTDPDAGTESEEANP